MGPFYRLVTSASELWKVELSKDSAKEYLQWLASARGREALSFLMGEYSPVARVQIFSRDAIAFAKSGLFFDNPFYVHCS